MYKKGDINIGYRAVEELYDLYENISQAARMVGVTRDCLLKWEHGVTPNGVHLAALLWLGCDIVYVLSGQRQEQARPPIGKKQSGKAIAKRLAKEAHRLFGAEKKTCAAKLGCTEKTFYIYEKGQSCPGGLRIQKMYYLGADVYYILSGERMQKL